MNDLRTLRDAFDELERRADAAPQPAAVPGRNGSAGRRLLAPSAAAVTVAATAAAIVLWPHADPRPPASHQAAGPSSAAPTTPAAASTGNGRYEPPDSGIELTAKTRAILAGLATIAVSYESPTATAGPTVAGPGVVIKKGHLNTLLPLVGGSGAGSGAAIVGTLTADGRTGGFDLDVFAAAPASKAACDADTNCSVQERSDGSSLAIGSWHDGAVAGGMTYQVELVRPDGADILFHLSTEHDPKGESTVTASQLPLTVAQMTDFVTSDRW